jgi:hypothetical protein
MIAGTTPATAAAIPLEDTASRAGAAALTAVYIFRRSEVEIEENGG